MQPFAAPCSPSPHPRGLPSPSAALPPAVLPPTPASAEAEPPTLSQQDPGTTRPPPTKAQGTHAPRPRAPTVSGDKESAVATLAEPRCRTRKSSARRRPHQNARNRGGQRPLDLPGARPLLPNPLGPLLAVTGASWTNSGTAPNNER